MATRGVPVQGLVTWQDQHQRQQQLGDQEQQQEQGSTAADETPAPPSTSNPAPTPTPTAASNSSADPSHSPAPSAPSPSSSSYAVERALNAKIVVWEGAPWKLEVDALVIPTNETLTDRRGATGVVFGQAGPQVDWDCHLHGRQRTGSAVRTRAGSLPCRTLIHAVTPRYSAKYSLAAENALHQAYRAALRAVLEGEEEEEGESGEEEGGGGVAAAAPPSSSSSSSSAVGDGAASSSSSSSSSTSGSASRRERGLRPRGKGKTVAFACLYPARKGYPPAAAAHVALRTVRRFLEHHDAVFEKIIFAFLPGEASTSSSSSTSTRSTALAELEGDRLREFRRALPLFFPRDASEAAAASAAAAAAAAAGPEGAAQGGACFNEWGERVLDARRIRVASSLRPASAPPPPSSNTKTSKAAAATAAEKRETPAAAATAAAAAGGGGGGKRSYYLSAAQRRRLPLPQQLYIPPTPAFEAMVEDQDARRRAAVRRWYLSLPPEAQEAYRFKAYVSQARQTDLRAVEALGIVLGVVGEDRGGRPVVCVDARAYYQHFYSRGGGGGAVAGAGGKGTRGGRERGAEEGEEEEGEEEERPVGHDALLLWAVRVLESVRHRPYTLLLLDCTPPPPPLPPHKQPTTTTDAATAPTPAPAPAEWVHELGRLLSSPRYHPPLAALLVLHPSWGARVRLWAQPGFGRLLTKAVYLDSLAQLDLFARRDRLPGLFPSPLGRRLARADAALAHARREQRGQQQAAARATAAAEGVSIFALPLPLPPAPPPQQLPTTSSSGGGRRSQPAASAAASYGAALAPGTLQSTLSSSQAAAAATDHVSSSSSSRSSRRKGKAVAATAAAAAAAIPPGADRFAFAFAPPPFSNGPPPPAPAPVPVPAMAGGKGRRGKKEGKGDKENGPTSTSQNNSQRKGAGPGPPGVPYAAVGGWKRHSLL